MRPIGRTTPNHRTRPRYWSRQVLPKSDRRPAERELICCDSQRMLVDPQRRRCHGVTRTLNKLRRRGPRLALVASALLVAAGLSAPAALAADDYTQSVTQLSSTQLQLNFTPTTPAVYVDVHYTGVPGV